MTAAGRPPDRPCSWVATSSRTAGTITFGIFSLDEETERLSHANTVRPLRAKSFAVLCELARRRGRLVTKEELALAEEAPASVALETIGRRGFLA